MQCKNIVTVYENLLQGENAKCATGNFKNLVESIRFLVIFLDGTLQNEDINLY